MLALCLTRGRHSINICGLDDWVRGGLIRCLRHRDAEGGFLCRSGMSRRKKGPGLDPADSKALPWLAELPATSLQVPWPILDAAAAASTKGGTLPNCPLLVLHYGRWVAGDRASCLPFRLGLIVLHIMAASLLEQLSLLQDAHWGPNLE